MESEANEEVLASTPTEPGIMKYPCLMDCYAPNWTVNDVALVLRSLLLLYFVASSLPCHADPRPTADVPPHPVPWMFPTTLCTPTIPPPFHRPSSASAKSERERGHFPATSRHAAAPTRQLLRSNILAIEELLQWWTDGGDGDGEGANNIAADLCR